MRSLTLATIFAALAVPAVAKPVTYLCSMNGNSGGWVRPQVVLKIDTATGAARVLDDIVYNAHGKAVPADLNVKGKQNVVTWTVLVEDRKGQDTFMRYRAALLKNNREAIISATPGGGYNGRFSARGRCAPTNERYPGM